jgi:hypothetical protein
VWCTGSELLLRNQVDRVPYRAQRNLLRRVARSERQHRAPVPVCVWTPRILLASVARGAGLSRGGAEVAMSAPDNRAGARQQDASSWGWRDRRMPTPPEGGTRTHSGAVMARPARAATSGLSRSFALGGRAGVMSRPGQLWGVCDHAVISEPGGVQTSGRSSSPHQAACLVVHSRIQVVVVDRLHEACCVTGNAPAAPGLTIN